MYFTLFLSFVITQRLAELIIAKRNESWMLQNGAKEYFPNHYKFIVLLHIGFLISFISEGIIFNKEVSPIWPGLLILFGFTQLLRVWAITSLGKFWNTKIIILPNANIVKKGPYKFIRHPNYLIVGLEILLIPLLFQAYFTAIVFTILNAVILSIRIPLEEKALIEGTADYNKYMEYKNRFFVKIGKNLD
ncbi:MULTISPECIES: isoprenylcysteine carboxyl methyltransferase family protein [Bacillus]|uniref:isoprenylcysteine carboxyl methyltransferase family protein n=1 Tax=Bacillus TaxID=1386 RepID=UPI000BB9611E|nr:MULTISPECIES: isoprenylcysteine carboxylmethyltransferase family protein [Bacillus]